MQVEELKRITYDFHVHTLSHVKVKLRSHHSAQKQKEYLGYSRTDWKGKFNGPSIDATEAVVTDCYVIESILRVDFSIPP